MRRGEPKQDKSEQDGTRGVRHDPKMKVTKEEQSESHPNFPVGAIPSLSHPGGGPGSKGKRKCRSDGSKYFSGMQTGKMGKGKARITRWQGGARAPSVFSTTLKGYHCPGGTKKRKGDSVGERPWA